MAAVISGMLLVAALLVWSLSILPQALGAPISSSSRPYWALPSPSVHHLFHHIPTPPAAQAFTRPSAPLFHAANPACFLSCPFASVSFLPAPLHGSAWPLATTPVSRSLSSASALSLPSSLPSPIKPRIQCSPIYILPSLLAPEKPRSPGGPRPAATRPCHTSAQCLKGPCQPQEGVQASRGAQLCPSGNVVRQGPSSCPNLSSLRTVNRGGVHLPPVQPPHLCLLPPVLGGLSCPPDILRSRYQVVLVELSPHTDYQLKATVQGCPIGNQCQWPAPYKIEANDSGVSDHWCCSKLCHAQHGDHKYSSGCTANCLPLFKFTEIYEKATRGGGKGTGGSRSAPSAAQQPTTESTGSSQSQEGSSLSGSPVVFEELEYHEPSVDNTMHAGFITNS
ncbi:meiosis arrest female protein 1 isoform X1 [Lates japonicus]|uniref:Meiosis arrest female protein 1 isoform X1 n=1 Tax=Lates japonicus TaxID=270547 RepID=A0AAD3MVH4_LATJO|nr:meiosis arrest female protein 1 isoform X1 [Lates japonicus]